MFFLREANFVLREAKIRESTEREFCLLCIFKQSRNTVRLGMYIHKLYAHVLDLVRGRTFLVRVDVCVCACVGDCVCVCARAHARSHVDVV